MSRSSKMVFNNNRVRRVSQKTSKGDMLLGNSIDAKDTSVDCQDGQVYGIVNKSLGGSWILCDCADGIQRMCHIRGKMRKKEWVNEGDSLLISVRGKPLGDQNSANKNKTGSSLEKADIICKLTASQTAELKKTNTAFKKSLEAKSSKNSLETKEGYLDDDSYDFEGI